MGDDADVELELTAREAVIVGIDPETWIGVFDRLGKVGIMEGGVALNEGKMLLLRVTCLLYTSDAADE